MEDDLDVRAFGDSGEGESLIEVGDQSRRKVVPAGVTGEQQTMTVYSQMKKR